MSGPRFLATQTYYAADIDNQKQAQQPAAARISGRRREGAYSVRMQQVLRRGIYQHAGGNAILRMHVESKRVLLHRCIAKAACRTELLFKCSASVAQPDVAYRRAHDRRRIAFDKSPVFGAPECFDGISMPRTGGDVCAAVQGDVPRNRALRVRRSPDDFSGLPIHALCTATMRDRGAEGIDRLARSIHISQIIGVRACVVVDTGFKI